MEERYFKKVNNKWIEAPQTKTTDKATIYNYNTESNLAMLIEDGYTRERDINPKELINPELVIGRMEFLKGKSEEELKAIDVTLLGLINRKVYARGYKTKSLFYCKDGLLAVRINYELTEEGEEKLIHWLDTDGNVVFWKQETDVYTAKDFAKKHKDIRETQMLYLQNPEEVFINPQMKTYIDVLFERYKSEVSDYILNGSHALLTAIATETDAQILGILNFVLPDNHSVKQSINYQITGTWE